ncbi:MAG: 6-phospho-beta-glucosidase [Chloroflexi bacterium]|nr:6-phospho-beta-glucosidase [Chloroflexota bacterium]
MKIALLGGGGFRVPQVYGALLARADDLGLEAVSLHDVDRSRLARIEPVLEGLARERGRTLSFAPTTDLDAAVDGADFVFCAIRVGGLDGRVVDELVPLAEGVVGQETTGPGGIAFALRTVPVMVDIAEHVARRAPRAWFVNFTNPAGLVTEAVQDVLGERAIGICDSATGLFRRVAGALGRGPDGLRFDYFGLNHLGWLRAVRDGEGDLLPGLLADDGRLVAFEEGQLFGGAWLRALGMIPNEYLYFYYFAADTVAALRAGVEPRAAFLRRQQAAFYAAAEATPEEALTAWRAARRAREAHYLAEARAAAGLEGAEHEGDEEGGYEGEALALLEAIVHDRRRVLVVNTANRGALPFLDAAAVVEVPCMVSRAGADPLTVGDVPGHARALMEAVKDVERMAIGAALARSPDLAVKAIALHPLVPSVSVARRIFAAYARQHPALRSWAP